MSETATPEATPAVTPPAPVVDPLKAPEKTFDAAYVKELRDEAAAARVGKKEAVEAAETALKTAHAAEIAARDIAYTELQNELGNAWIELEKVYISLDADVPSEKVRAFTAILQGTDAETIGASAKSNLELIGGFGKAPVRGFDPTQGFGGRKEDMPLNGDPILEAIKKAVGVL